MARLTKKAAASMISNLCDHVQALLTKDEAKLRQAFENAGPGKLKIDCTIYCSGTNDVQDLELTCAWVMDRHKEKQVWRLEWRQGQLFEKDKPDDEDEDGGVLEGDA